MPIFDMKCSKCGFEETDVILNDPDNQHLCKLCQEPMVKLPSMFGFTMKADWVTKTKRKMGNVVPPEYKTSGGANFGKINQ